MKTKWNECKENADGTGERYYQCTCCQRGTGMVALIQHRYDLCYFPQQSLLRFWDELDGSAEAVKMGCYNWDEAEMVKMMLKRV